ncbi:MAG: carbamate kinase [Myxococcota bacterium]
MILEHHRDLGAPPLERLAVLAMGGNALMPAGEAGTAKEQLRAARRLARTLVSVVREGFRVLVVHGNGPQVGRELLRVEEAATKLPPRTLDTCVAATQGTMGYRIELALRNALRKAGLRRPVTSVLTDVLVSPDDPAFGAPSKPVGPFYTGWRARQLARSKGWRMVEDAGRGWRQVVPSPRPVDVLGLAGIEALLDAGHVVVAGGGGGVPVAVDARGRLVGLEGVVDKDRTAALLGGDLGADLLVFLAPVDYVYQNFGRTDQAPIERVSRHELRALSEAGHFPAGSMGPKVEAALDFLDDGGSAVIITSGDKLPAALADRAGTRVTREDTDGAVRNQLDLFPDARPPLDDDDDEDLDA